MLAPELGPVCGVTANAKLAVAWARDDRQDAAAVQDTFAPRRISQDADAITTNRGDGVDAGMEVRGRLEPGEPREDHIAEHTERDCAY